MDLVTTLFFAIFDIGNVGADLLGAKVVPFSLNFFMYIVHSLLKCEQWQGQRFRSGFTDLLLARLGFFFSRLGKLSVSVWTIVLPAWILSTSFHLTFHCGKKPF